MTGNVTVKMARNTIINAKCVRLGRIMTVCARAQARGDSIINYSVAFTLACNGVLMHIGTALSWVCVHARLEYG